MKYRVAYLSIYCNKEEVELNHTIDAQSDKDAMKKVRRFIRDKNRRNQHEQHELEHFELVGVCRIVRKAVIEKTVPIPLS